MTNIKKLYDNVHQLVLPIETEFIIPEDDSVRLLSQVMEELDYTNLYKAYSTKGRNPAIQPKTGLMSIFWTQKVKLFYAALLANNSH